MKRTLIALLALSGLLVTAAPAAAASERAAALKRDLGSGVKVSQHRETGAVRFVGAATGKRIARPSGVSASAPPADAARAFLGRHADAFGLRSQASELRVEATRGGSRPSVRFQQVEGGVPVIAGELVANLDAQRNLLSVSGETLPDAKVDTSPRLSSSAARDNATAAIAKGEGVSGARLDAGIPELGIYDARLLGGPGPNEPTLVWQVEVKGRGGLLVDQLVFVDAQTGSVALHINQVENIKNRSVCDANNSSGSGGAYPCTAPVRTEGSIPLPGEDGDVEPAYAFAGETYDFYFTRFGRDSLDGEGLPLKSTVDYCDPNDDCPLPNAFWDGQQMAYGDGFASADDVVGHELTHGVTEFSSHLLYWFQSGAINESLSDVFGEFVDQTNSAGGGNDTPAVKWQVGEDLSIGAIRNMKNPADNPNSTVPAEEFNDPDRMTSSNYTIDQGEGDSGGVHTNSGVNNKAAYLITDGDTFNGRTITGLGVTKAARIYYEVETAFLTSGSDYADLGSALGQACDNLVGTVGITAADCTQVRSAVAATEMATDPPNARAPEAPAAACGAKQVLQNRFFDNMESDSSGANWFMDDLSVWNFDSDYAHSGDFDLHGADFSGPAGTRSLELDRNVALPAGATSFLRFDHAYGFDDSGTTSFLDGGVLEFSTNGGSTWADISTLPEPVDVGYNGTINGTGNPLVGRNAFVSESNGYRATRATLTSLAGQSVRFRFTIGTASASTVGGGRGWFIDDVRIYSCLPDGDGDGVPNNADACPAVVGTQNGCPPATGGVGGPTPPPASGSGGSGTKVTLKSAKLRSCKISGKGKKLRVKCTLSRSGAVRRATITIKKGKKTVLKKSLKPTSKGVLSIKPKRKLAKGSYKVSIVIRDAAGKKRTLKKTLKVK
jgi:bacillolysin